MDGGAKWNLSHPNKEKKCRARLSDRRLRSVCTPKHITEPSDWVTPTLPRSFTGATMNGNPLFTLLKWQPQNIKRQLKRRQPQLEEWHLILINVIGRGGEKQREGSLWDGDLAIVLCWNIKRERLCTGAYRSCIRTAWAKSDMKSVPNLVADKGG